MNERTTPDGATRRVGPGATPAYGDAAASPRAETPAEPPAEPALERDPETDVVTSAAEGAEADAEAGASQPFVGQLMGLVGDAIGTFMAAADEAISGPNRTLRGRLRQIARDPLANLYEVFPEARDASPRELGLRFVPIEEIRGTAVAGAAQRGGDFLPLKPFRGSNWAGRWQRIWRASERLESLPPVDLVKFAGDYWVLDGHNRVAAVLYSNGVGVDAIVTELVPLDGKASEPATGLLGILAEGAAMRTAAQGLRPALQVRPLQPPADGLEPDRTKARRPGRRADWTRAAGGADKPRPGSGRDSGR